MTGMISVTQKGDFNSTESYLKRLLQQRNILAILNAGGQAGVNALEAATTVETGLTAGSWYYEIESDSSSVAIIWGNTHIEDGRPIAILLQYGHGTGTGGYVAGRDYINPALAPIFAKIEADVWKAVTA